mmetsp:Transcript_42130/g.63624  ORF Transcript_42130/g.63624 Transcript_42130/m.63624 type:complete len:188 (-) Transcript_42130:66-629(-)
MHTPSMPFFSCNNNHIYFFLKFVFVLSLCNWFYYHLSTSSAVLDELIENDDWEGIVAVGSQQHPQQDGSISNNLEADKHGSKSTESPMSSKAAQECELNAESERHGSYTRDEKEALSQAKLWATIAKQASAKTAAVSNNGANIATQWAIQRSLSNADGVRGQDGKITTGTVMEPVVEGGEFGPFAQM